MIGGAALVSSLPLQEETLRRIRPIDAFAAIGFCQGLIIGHWSGRINKQSGQFVRGLTVLSATNNASDFP